MPTCPASVAIRRRSSLVRSASSACRCCSTRRAFTTTGAASIGDLGGKRNVLRRMPAAGSAHEERQGPHQFVAIAHGHGDHRGACHLPQHVQLLLVGRDTAIPGVIGVGVQGGFAGGERAKVHVRARVPHPLGRRQQRFDVGRLIGSHGTPHAVAMDHVEDPEIGQLRKAGAYGLAHRIVEIRGRCQQPGGAAEYLQLHFGRSRRRHGWMGSHRGILAYFTRAGPWGLTLPAGSACCRRSWGYNVGLCWQTPNGLINSSWGTRSYGARARSSLAPSCCTFWKFIS